MELLNTCPICESEKSKLYLSSKDYFLTNESFEIVSCSNCGFCYTNPRPESKNLNKYYQSSEYISHSDANKGLLASVYQIVRKYTLRKKKNLILGLHTSGKLLDIGCATGQFLSSMKSKDWEVLGIEPDEKTRNYAKTEFALQVFAEDYLNEIETASIDVITMWHVLEHVSELAIRMEQLKRLIKPEGTIIIALPNHNSYDAKKYGLFWAGFDLPRHLYHFTKKDVTSLAKKFGFTIVNVLPMKFDAFYVSLLSEKYKSGKMRWIPGLWNGFWSNLNSGGEKGFSSQIYVLKLK